MFFTSRLFLYTALQSVLTTTNIDGKLQPRKQKNEYPLRLYDRERKWIWKGYKNIGILWFQLILGNGRLFYFMRLIDIFDYTLMRLGY
jgi:hypothetical protein